jgi:hypothetical protein
MTGVGENLAMLDIPAMPCVMVNPRVGVATKDVFALGLGKGELLAGVGDVMLSPDGRRTGVVRRMDRRHRTRHQRSGKSRRCRSSR